MIYTFVSGNVVTKSTITPDKLSGIDFVVVIVQLEVVEHVMGYSEYDLTKNKLVETVNLKYPPSVFNTVGLVSIYTASPTC